MLVKKSGALERARKWVFRSRLLIGLIAVCLSAFFVRPSFSTARYDGLWKALGFFLLCTGLFLRIWGAGSAGKHTRSSKIEADELATGGPYAHVRNPIYLGSMVLGLGMVCLIGDWIMFFPYAITFVFLYIFIVPGEEAFLRRKFKHDYSIYEKNVPRFLPRRSRWSDAKQVLFDREAAVKEWRITSVCAGILILYYFVAKGRGA